LIPIRRQLQGTGDSFLQVVLSLWGNRLLHRLLTAEVTDFTSGYYAVRRNLVRDVGLRGTYVDYCIRLAYLASLRGYVIAEVPVVVHPRMGGASKTATSISGLFRISLSCLRTAWELRMHRRDFQRRKAGR
ncbi:MAG: hypothetical protein RL477_94, partial [Pseudomonadota bacterium]